MSEPLIQAQGISKAYRLPRRTVPVLKDVDFDVPANEFVAIMGPSGSGKSTLLHILGGLDRPTDGRYLLAGRDVFACRDSVLARIRAREIGFVFQSFNLVNTLTVYENVELPFVYALDGAGDIPAKVRRAIAAVGLTHRIHHRPAELSGGELQRAAIARALAAQPKLLLADEPTGNLDSATSQEIMERFQQLHAMGVTVVMVTHDAAIARQAQRIVVLEDGGLRAPAPFRGLAVTGRARQNPPIGDGPS